MTPSRPRPPAPRTPVRQKSTTPAPSTTAATKSASAKSAAEKPASAPVSLDQARSRRAATSEKARPATEQVGRDSAGPVVTHGHAARLAERRAMGRRHRVRIVSIWSAAVLAAGAIVWMLFFSPVLAVDAEDVSVAGVDAYIDADAVDAVVADAAGTPLPRLDTVGMRDRLLELPGVDDARVLRAWPAGLDVTVSPRTPVAAVPSDDGTELLDADGVAVATVTSVPKGLPLIEIETDDAAARARAMRAALVVLNTLPSETRAEVAEVSADTQDDVMTVMRNGTEVEWGNAERVELKIAVLEELQGLDESADATVFDVSSPTRPITR
ncbi:cell division protein FtsQ/DivIB [Paraoerskovia marina]|uniref:cell division protein FtsQ/DivIB n=1 Tax=Paraoerskovia marina TaxID=545619 RepID=UPI0012DC5576|nr:cell division protein FtsQ/DivIB [Paraoerskovia marina]